MPKCEICGKEVKNPDSDSHIKTEFHQDAIRELTSKMEYVIYQRYPPRYQFLKKKNSLDLSEKGIWKITSIEGLKDLTKLEELILRKNRITEIDGLDSLGKLKVLDLSENRDIKKIEGLDNLVELEELNLNCTYIYNIWGIENLVNLKRLNLGRTAIDKEIIEELGGMDDEGWVNEPLRFVEYSRGLAGKTVRYEGQIVQVKEGKLSFSDDWMTSMREIEGLDKLFDLKELDLSGNCFREIVGLENLVSLEILNLSDPNTYGSPDPWADAWGREFYPPISEIKGLDNLKNLRELYIGGHNIREIKGLENLTKLEILDLSSQLSEIDSHRAQIKRLKHSFREIKGLDNLVNLKVLNLSNNGISKMEGLDTLTNLQVLDLRKNSIKKIEGLGNLKNLKELYLDGNRIPENFTLHIDSNFTPITGLENLQKLEKFDLKINWVFKINDWLRIDKTVDDKVKIFVGDTLFESKQYVLLKIPEIDDELLYDIASIDDVVPNGYRHSKEEWDLFPGREREHEKLRIEADGQVYGYTTSTMYNSKFNKYRNFKMPRIPVDDVYWATCSNLQAWAENDYNTRLLHSKLAFPLLKALMEAGDPVANKVYKKELIEKVLSGPDTSLFYLSSERYLDVLDDEDFAMIIEGCKDEPVRALSAHPDLTMLALQKHVNEPKQYQEYIKDIVEKLPKEERAGKYFQVGRILINMKQRELSKKKLTMKSRSSTINLGIKILELATGFPNCPEELIYYLSGIHSLRGEKEMGLKVNERGYELFSNPEFLSNIFYFASILKDKDTISKYLPLVLKKKSLSTRQTLLTNLLYALNVLDSEDARATGMKLIREFWKSHKKKCEKLNLRLDATLWVNLTWAYVITNTIDKTLDEIVEKYLKKHKKKEMSPSIFENLAWYFLKKGQVDECIQYLKDGKKNKAPKFSAQYFTELKDHPDYEELFSS
ncbi:MAG: leucine-rich repeat domain-containing protein [Candidatus Hodarchaeota archaeon]